MSCQPQVCLFLVLWSAAVLDSLSSTSALLLSLASSNLGTTRGQRVFIMVSEIQNNGISIKLYPGNNL